MGLLEIVWFLAFYLRPCLARNSDTPQPSVSILNGTVVGYVDGTLEIFKGIPYAQPPVGSKRLRPPEALSSTFGTFMATASPTICPQLIVPPNGPTPTTPAAALGPLNSFVGYIANPATSNATAGEDCLNLNVLRPLGTHSQSRLPVVAWFFGGGFIAGSTEDTNPTKFMQASIDIGEPFIFVAMNYRVAAFGFLGGKELSEEGSTNLGLRDQRLALKWIQENIGAFGGESKKVTLWGISAGSISVFDQTIIENGNNLHHGQRLFERAIMDSGSVVAALPVTHPKVQDVFDALVKKVGCDNAASKTACIRSTDYKQLLAAQNDIGSQPYRSLDEVYFARPDPASSFYPLSADEAIISGYFSKTPFVIGNNEDEGTLFGLPQSNISTNDQVIEYMHSWWPESSLRVARDFIESYPEDPSAGSPFRTGQANNIYPQFKRLSAVIGDIIFTLSRRLHLDHVANAVPVWSYLDSHRHFDLPVFGTFHGSQNLAQFQGKLAESSIVDEFRTRYISFIRYGDPNAILNSEYGKTSLPWPLYNNVTRQLLHFKNASVGLLRDDFRWAQYENLKANIKVLRQ